MRKSLMLCGAAAILLCVGTAWGQVCERGASLYEQAMSAGKVQAKIQLLQDSISACPNYPALIELGKMYAGLNRLDESEAVLKQAQDLADDDESKASALAYLGQIFAVTGRYRESVDAFRESIDLHAFDNVKEMLKASEIKLAEQPLSAADIIAGLKKIDQGEPDQRGVNLHLNFAYGRTNLTESGEVQAAQLALALNDAAFEGREFVLIGHTDSKGSDDINKKVSRKRAEALRDFLVVQYSMDPAVFHIEGKGKQDLLYPGDSEEDNMLNRRVEVKLLRPAEPEDEAKDEAKLE